VNTIGSIHGNKAFQKTVYFVQRFGLDLQYDFKWSLFGPYSRQLAEEILSCVSLGFLTKESDWEYKLGKMARLFEDLGKIPSSELEILKRSKKFVSNRSPLNLELLASIHYLWNEAYLRRKDQKHVFEILEMMKPGKFSKADRQIAWEYLTANDLLRN
jgi:uncharacterized protein YwgA